MDGTVPLKDEEREHSVPIAWRPVIERVVDRLAAGDFSLRNGVDGVGPVAASTSEQIRAALGDYGASLVKLDAQTWDSSVASWNGATWDVLVDLWTEQEGRSDLVLHLTARQSGASHRFEVYLLYVP